MVNMDNNQVQRIKELFNLAVKNHTSNNIEEAQKLYKEVLKINPNHSNALNNLGIISYNLGDNRKAVNYYEKAITSDQNNSNAYNNLGVVFKILGEEHKAKDCYERAIKINPNYADAYNNLGIIFYNSGNNQKAKDCYEKAIEIDPNNTNFLNNVINLALSIGFADLYYFYCVGNENLSNNRFKKIYKYNGNINQVYHDLLQYDKLVVVIMSYRPIDLIFITHLRSKFKDLKTISVQHGMYSDKLERSSLLSFFINTFKRLISYVITILRIDIFTLKQKLLILKEIFLVFIQLKVYQI